MSNHPTLKKGSTGAAVILLQQKLLAMKYQVGEPDGEFGNQTLHAVKLFQMDRKLGVDGVVGAATWAALLKDSPVFKPVVINPSQGSTLGGLLVEIAGRDVGQVETPRNNQGAWIKKFWPATSYTTGYVKKEPYCAAAMCYWLKTLGEELEAAGKLKELTGMTLAQWEKWRCKSARAWDWHEWGKKAKGVQVLPDSAVPQPGDIMVFDISHIGLVERQTSYQRIATIEANTGPAGERDGDGCWQKSRPQEIARVFLRFNFVV